MRLSLVALRSRHLILALAWFFCAFLSVEAGRVWLADHWARAGDPQDWERAATLEPGNAEHWRRLARFRQWDLQDPDLPRAIQHYQRATAANPRSPYLWMDLAGAWEMSGDFARARQAFHKAVENYPLSAEVAWNEGNFLLRAGEPAAAFAEIRRAIARSPELVPLAVSVCWRAGLDAGRIVRELLPPRARAHRDAFDSFLRMGEVDAALQVWDAWRALPEPLDPRQVFPLVNELISRERIGDARRIWQQALERARWLSAGPAGSLIWDGGFEKEILNSAFGWRKDELPNAAVHLDPSEVHSGSRSLLIVFDGRENLEFQHLYQLVAVEPATRYRFLGYLRTESLSTESGIRFRISDLRRPAFQAFTVGLTGSAPWTQQEIEFTTGPETHLLIVSLYRSPSGKLDNKLRGSVWVDDVSLVPTAPAPVQGNR